jgi:cytochrome c peroxidase
MPPSRTTDAPSGSADDADPVFSPAELGLLARLSPAKLPAPPPDVSNRFADDARAAVLGQKVFFDPGFSGKLLDGDDDGGTSTLGARGETGRVACAGCHVPAAGFSDDRTLGHQVSLAAGWGRRRAPSLLDVGQAKLLMWDGRRDALYNQPFGPIESPVEMNGSRLYVAEQIYARYRTEYEAIFGAMPRLGDPVRFPPLNAAVAGCQPATVDPEPVCNGAMHGMPGDRAEFDGLAPDDRLVVTRVLVNVGKALGAYERRLSCGPARFDSWMHGRREALTRSEKRGAELFVGRARCVSCHSGPYFSDQNFHNVGLKPGIVAVVFTDENDRGAARGLSEARLDPLNVRGQFSDGDDGRLAPTARKDLEGAFRTPTLRCAARRPSYMHTGQLRTLDDVVAFFARGGDRFGYLGESEIHPLDLTRSERTDLVAFLKSLEGAGPPLALSRP